MTSKASEVDGRGLRVGLVCPYSLSIPGGVQGQVMGLARTLLDLGHEIRVLAPCDGPPPAPFVTSVGASVPLAANGSVAPVAPDLAAARRTLASLRDERFDVLHLHEPLVPGPAMTALLAKPAPIVGTFHAAGGSAAYRWLGPAVRWFARRIDVRCVVSEDARHMAADTLRGSYEELFNGVDVAAFSGVEPWPTTKPTIFFLGRHEPRKGLSVLLDACRDLPTDLTVWVAGDGPQTDDLRAQMRGDDRIEWLGRLDDVEVRRRMAGADVFCAPSLRGESFGVVLLEAMAAGTAVVAGDNPGYRRVAGDGEFAVLTPPGDVEALGAALADVLSDPGRRSALVARARTRAAEFSMQALADRYVELYRSLR